MRLAPQQKLVTAFIAAALVSLAIGMLAYWGASRIRDDAVWAARKQQVAGALRAIFPIDADLLTAERGYVLTGDDAYLRMYHEAVASAGSTLRRARALTADDPSQQRRLQVITRLVDQLEAFTARTLSVRRAQGVSPAAELLLSGTGQGFRHAINANVAQMIAEQHRHLTQRRIQISRASNMALDLIVAGSALAMLIGLVATVRIRADLLALQRAEERFRSLLESAPDAMVVVDGNGNIVVVNARTEALFGYDRQELIGKPIEILLPERDGSEHPAHRGTCAREPALPATSAGLELFARRRDGSQIPVEVSSSPVAASGGLQIASAIRDISERKRALEQLREARAAAEKADRAKSTFLATASHDLRQPLQTISLLNGALRRMGRDTDPADALARQDAAISVMSHLLNALLDISKLESGAVKPVLTDWPISALFEQLRDEFTSAAAHKGVQLQVQGSSAWVHSDLSLLGQVLRNLLSNAIKYTHRGSVRLRAWAEGERVHIEVSDTGIGMAPEELSHINQEFYQIGVPANATREGYGLGLSIVSRIVKLLSLELDVHSQIGKGSTFALQVPAGLAGLSATGHSDPSPAAARSAASAHQVLVVGDEPSVLNATRLLLTAAGFGVATATSLEQAIARARESHDLQLVITDHRLSDGETGKQVIASVRQLRGPDLKGVLITGDDSGAAHGVGGDEHLHILSKPVEPNVLLGLLKDLLAPRAPLPDQT
jgi:PAS domain S-box-containing protein